MNHFEENDAVVIENFKYWENKKRYLELMERFIDEKIDGREFDSEFCQMWSKDRDKTYSSQELLYLAEHVDLTQLKGFSGLMSKLFTDCDVFQPDPSLRKDYEISEKELKNCVQKTFLEIKNCYP